MSFSLLKDASLCVFSGGRSGKLKILGPSVVTERGVWRDRGLDMILKQADQQATPQEHEQTCMCTGHVLVPLHKLIPGGGSFTGQSLKVVCKMAFWFLALYVPPAPSSLVQQLLLVDIGHSASLTQDSG